MQDSTPANNRYAVIAVMGATGTGKSTFIKHVTGNEKVVIGHRTDSETIDIQVYFYTDPLTGLPAVLVDTPGFDDSREGVTDTDILEKIAVFLQHDGGQKLNGIIYMHRITDNRVGGVSRKNIKMFKALCGDENLSNVRIVTTHWDCVSAEVGASREEDLAGGAFKSLVTTGAQMVRQDQGRESALGIVSELIPKVPIEVQLLGEIKAGRSLGDTSAGNVINEEIKRLQRQHQKDLEDLRKEMEEAARTRDEQLKAELAAERRVLQSKMDKLEDDKRTLHDKHEADLKKELREMRERAEKRDTELQTRITDLQTQLANQDDGGWCMIQ